MKHVISREDLEPRGPTSLSFDMMKNLFAKYLAMLRGAFSR